MTESELLAQVLLACSNGGTRLLRANAGVAWQGRIIEHTHDRLVMLYPKPIKLMAPGVSDLIGWHTISSAGAAPVAIFTALELKVGRRQPTAEQVAFLNLVQRAGGISGVARSVEEARAILSIPCPEET